MNNFKKVLFLFAIYLSYCFFSGCNKETELTKSNIIKAEDFEYIGIEHNNGLDFIFNKLDSILSIKSPELKSAIDIREIAKSATKEFMEKFNIHKDVKTSLLNIINKNFSRSSTISNKSAEVNIFQDLLIQESLSKNQILLLGKLEKIILNFKQENLTVSIKNIKNIEKECESLLPENEQITLFTATSVAKKSVEYWSQNAAKWIGISKSKKVHPTLSKSQQKTLDTNIQGIVVDYDNNPLPGVSVWVLGSSFGAVTDLDGRYSFTYNKPYPFTIRFSMVGFTTVDVTVNEECDIFVRMEDESWFSWGAVIGADVGTAATIAGTAWAANTIIGPGTVAYGSTIIVGGLSASGGEALGQILGF